MRAALVAVVASFVAAACQSRPAPPLALDGGVRTDGCSASSATFPSNGVRLKPGTDPDEVTQLVGRCEINTVAGVIECEAAQMGGLQSGHFEVLPAVASDCDCMAGATPPSIAVFSFGSLEITGSAEINIGFGLNPVPPFPNYAVALVAARSITIRGHIDVASGGFGVRYYGVESDTGPGPAPGFDARPDGPGAGGAGGATPGAAGGAGGAPGGWELAPALEPLCGGSAGGNVVDGRGRLYARGGGGGGALMLVAGERIELQGIGDFCAVTSYGGTGELSQAGGQGGGAGGMIVLESPQLSIGPTCWVASLGAGGAGGASGVGCSQLGADCNARWPLWLPPPQAQHGLGPGPGGGAGGLGGALDPPQPGGDGDWGGGGGGAAGFVFVRTSDCGALSDHIVPPPVCQVLPSPLPPL